LYGAFVGISITLFVLTGVLVAVIRCYAGGDDQTSPPNEDIGFGTGATVDPMANPSVVHGSGTPPAGGLDAALIREQILAMKELTAAIKAAPTAPGILRATAINAAPHQGSSAI